MFRYYSNPDPDNIPRLGEAVTQCITASLLMEEDPVAGAKLMQQAAEQGLIAAQFMLGQAYSTGTGVNKNRNTATKWYLEAAKQGNLKAQYLVGFAYRSGEGMPQDQAKAIMWFRKAADEGMPEAQFVIGSFFQFGDGLRKDAKQAVDWYRKAADQGHPGAQGFLGSLYAVGATGVRRDLVEGYMWLALAAAQDDAKATEALGVVKKHMKNGQIAEAERRVKAWHKKPAY